MLTLDYLNQIFFRTVTDANGNEAKVPEIEGLTNPDWLMECRAGMDGAIQLLQLKNVPVGVVLEHAESGRLMLRNDGGFQEAVQSLWVMEQVPNGGNAATVMDRCLARVERIYSILILHRKDAPLRGWIENNEVGYYAREAGAYVGYEMTVHFRENRNLSYAQPNH